MVLEEAQRWTPGIGDPTIMGWVTVAACAFAVFVFVRGARLVFIIVRVTSFHHVDLMPYMCSGAGGSIGFSNSAAWRALPWRCLRALSTLAFLT
jgi:hypothetical protein